MAVTAATLAQLVADSASDVAVAFALLSEGIATNNANTEIADALAGMKEICKKTYGQDGLDFIVMAEGMLQWYVVTKSTTPPLQACDLCVLALNGLQEHLLNCAYDTVAFFAPDPVPTHVPGSALVELSRSIQIMNGIAGMVDPGP